MLTTTLRPRAPGVYVHIPRYEHIALVLAEKLRLRAEQRGIGDSFRIARPRRQRSEPLPARINRDGTALYAKVDRP